MHTEVSPGAAHKKKLNVPDHQLDWCRDALSIGSTSTSWEHRALPLGRHSKAAGRACQQPLANSRFNGVFVFYLPGSRIRPLTSSSLGCQQHWCCSLLAQKSEMEKISQVTLSLPWPDYSCRAFSIQAEVPHSNKILKGMNQTERVQGWATAAASLMQGQTLSPHFQENTTPSTVLHLFLEVQCPILQCVVEKPMPELLTGRCPSRGVMLSDT